MKIQLNVEKKYFFALLLAGLVLIGIAGVVAFNNDVTPTSGNPPNFGHSVDEMDWSKTVQKNISAVGFCIGTSCITAWPSGGGGGGSWTTAGSNIYYSAGKVGIGTTGPIETLHVVGSIMSEGTGGGSRVVLKSSASGGHQYEWYLDTPAVGDISLFDRTAGRYPIVVKSGGNVGINGASGNANLDVAGTIRSTSGGFVFPDGSTQLKAVNPPCSSLTWVVTGQGSNYYGPWITSPPTGAASAGTECYNPGDWHSYMNEYTCGQYGASDVNRTCLDYAHWNYATNGPGLDYRVVYCKPYIYGVQCASPYS